MSKIALIAALAENNAIGNENKLLYWIPEDLKRFKALTTGHTIVMGRRTFESLPKGALPNRRNIVLSRQPGIIFPGAECYASLEEALQHCQADETVFIIGGASVYHEALPMSDLLYLTHIDHTPATADAFFPKIDPHVWIQKNRDAHPVDEKHPYSYTFVDYERSK